MRKLSAVLFLIIAIVAGALDAQFNVDPVMSYSFGGAIGRGPSHYIDADFGSTAHTEAWTFSIVTDTNEPVQLVILEIPTLSTATTTTAYNSGILGGNYAPPTGGGTGTLAYTTPSLSGAHRFVVWIQLTSTSGNLASTTVSVSVNNGTNTATATTGGGAAWNVYNGGIINLGDSGTSSADTLYMPSTLRCWTRITSATDRIAYDADVDHGTNGVAIDLGLFGSYSGAGTGGGGTSVQLYDMTKDGGQVPVITSSVSGTVATPVSDTGTYKTPSRTGIHRYRVVITGAAGFSASPEVYSHLSWSFIPPFSQAQSPVNYSTPVAVTQIGTTISVNTNLTASGGSGAPSYDWSIVGTAPTGVTLSGTSGTNVDLQFTGTISGTVTVRVDNGTTSEWVEETYSYNVVAPSISIDTAVLTDGIAGLAYSSGLSATATNTTGPYTWSSSNLPTWLSLGGANTLTELLSGSPQSGDVGSHTFNITCSDGSVSDTKSFTIDVLTTGSILITTTSVADGTTLQAYSASFIAIGGTGSKTWSLATGTLPPGLSLGGSSTNSEGISGIPTQAGTYSFSIHITDGTNTDTQAYSLTIIAGGTGIMGSSGGGGCAIATERNQTWLLLIVISVLLAVVSLKKKQARW